MSIPLITEVSDEVRRLCLAGSGAAIGDFRLKKLVSPLEVAGKKAPVFGKVAQAIQTLIDSDESEAPAALLELSTLLNAILYTQGETGVAGTLTPIVTTDLGATQTQVTARVIKPLLEALTNTGAGRLEVIKAAQARGHFRDLRLVQPAIAALDDVYGEIADFVAENVLPLYGTAILPTLRSQFQFKGRSGDVRRLKLMHALDPDGTHKLVTQSLEEGSKEVKVAAIECLGDSVNEIELLIDLAKSRSQDVRRATLTALAKMPHDLANMAIARAIETDDLELMIEPMRSMANPKLIRLLLKATCDQFDAITATTVDEKVPIAKRCKRMVALLECLRGHSDHESEELLLSVFARRDQLLPLKSDPGGDDIRLKLCSMLSEGSKRLCDALIDARDTLNSDEMGFAFLAALNSRGPKEVYDLFGTYYRAQPNRKEKKDNLARYQKLAISFGLLYGRTTRFHVEEVLERPLPDLDPRWLDDAVEQEDLKVVKAILRPGHVKASQFLLNILDANVAKKMSQHEIVDILLALLRIKHPGAVDRLLKIILSTSTNVHGLHWLASVFEHFPLEAIPQLVALLPQLPDKTANQLLVYLGESSVS